MKDGICGVPFDLAEETGQDAHVGILFAENLEAPFRTIHGEDRLY